MESTENNFVDYTKLMRKSTREIHSISDALINAKLAFALSNDRVWAEGLLIFYEVFKFLERAIEETQNVHLKQFYFNEVFRTKAFEQDLNHYLGPDWNKNYIPRISVRRYLNYLGKLERNEPELLIAYFYHLYMGLLSGGQILRKKRALLSKIYFATSSKNGNGDAVTEFTEPIADLKQKIRKLTNEVCNQIESTDMREKIVKEGQMVFTLNNEIVATIKSTNSVVLKRVVCSVVIFGVSYIILRYLIKS